MGVSSPGKLTYLAFLILLVIGVITLQVGLSSINPLAYKEGNYQAVQAGLVLYFFAIIGYFVSRSLSYYKEKLTTRKRLWMHRVELMNASSDSISSGSAPSGGCRLSRQHTDDPQQQENIKFDQSFNYIRRIKHISPISYKINFTILNGIQILVLVTEFFQLASFPIRDLFRNISFLQSLTQPQGQAVQTLIEGVRALLASLSTGLVSVNYNYVKFVVAFWVTIVGLGISVLFSLAYFVLETEMAENHLSQRSRKVIANFVTGRWIVSSLPLVNLFYLVILNAFLEPLACFGSNSTPPWPAAFDNIDLAALQRIYECYPIYTANPSVNTWLALAGWTMSFFLFTICRTAQEPSNEDGAITYSSRSELFTKTSSITLLLIYALIPTAESSAARGSIAVIILFFMVLYNGMIGSTNVRKINSLRTLSYIFLLWMSAVVTYFTSPNNAAQLYEIGAGVFTVILVGWLVLYVFHLIADFLFIAPWERRCSEATMQTDSQQSMKELEERRPVGAGEEDKIGSNDLHIQRIADVVPVLPPRGIVYEVSHRPPSALPLAIAVVERDEGRANDVVSRHLSIVSVTSTSVARDSLMVGRDSLGVGRDSAGRSARLSRVSGARPMPDHFHPSSSSVNPRNSSSSTSMN